MTLSIEFSKSDIDKLKSERFNHPHPRVQIKMEALLLKSHGLPHHEIEEIVGISGNTLRTYMQDYCRGGIDELKKVCFKINQSDLSEYKETIEKYFTENPPKTAREAAKKLRN